MPLNKSKYFKKILLFRGDKYILPLDFIPTNLFSTMSIRPTPCDFLLRKNEIIRIFIFIEGYKLNLVPCFLIPDFI